VSIATIYTITPLDGTPITGRVQGSGGLLVGVAGLARLAYASDSRRFAGYEPAPGHVCVYPEWTPADNGPPVTVNIRGAKIEMSVDILDERSMQKVRP
jgi:hypothetical protein